MEVLIVILSCVAIVEGILCMCLFDTNAKTVKEMRAYLDEQAKAVSDRIKTQETYVQVLSSRVERIESGRKRR